jgi:uncharacterized protein
MAVTKALLELQSVDLEIDRLAARVRQLQSGDDLAAATREADEAERQLGELRLQLDALDRDGGRLEHEIDSLTKKSAAEETRLYDGSVANAKELDSIRHEIENLRRRREDREDQLLAYLEERDALERRAKEAEGRSSTLRVQVDQVAASSDAEVRDLRSRLDVDRTTRAEVAARIDPELLELYDDLRAHKKGVGAAALVDGVCQGCHESLSAVELDRVRKTNGVPRCEHCRRILVL